MNITNDFFTNLNNLYSVPRPLAAIWLNKPIQTAKNKTVRMEPRMLVKVKEGRLIDCNDNKPTHCIIGCFGTLYNQFEITLVDLESNETLTIKL